jgi:RNA:NAD 2'-phosphotransferase (TPT1/KptA family)
MAGGWDGTVKGAASSEKYGAVSGAHRDDGVSPAGSAPTEKRQHGWVTVSKPLDRGAVRVKVKMPWLDCKEGTAFPDAVLQNDAGRYELKDAIITGCAPDGVSLNYSKVTVKGWNPEKKED